MCIRDRHVYCRKQHQERRQNVKHDPQTLLRACGHRGKYIHVRAQPGYAGRAYYKRRGEIGEGAHRHKRFKSAAAARPAVTDRAELIHTAGMMSKADEAPAAARTEAIVVGTSWMEAVLSTTRVHSLSLIHI